MSLLFNTIIHPFFQILTGLFIDEWNMLLNVKFSATPRLKFKMFGNTYSITFDDLIEGTTEAFSSVGGKCTIVFWRPVHQ